MTAAGTISSFDWLVVDFRSGRAPKVAIRLRRMGFGEVSSRVFAGAGQGADVGYRDSFSLGDHGCVGGTTE